jgi:hypothetical protein
MRRTCLPVIIPTIVAAALFATGCANDAPNRLTGSDSGPALLSSSGVLVPECRFAEGRDLLRVSFAEACPPQT